MGGIGSGLPPNPNNKRIVAMRKQGMKLQEIADQFGITRERVRQICEEAGLAPIRSEHFANETELSRYIPYAQTRPCLLCGSERLRNRDFCAECDEFVKIVRDIKERLTYDLNGKVPGNGHSYQYRNSALWLIRKYGIKPEDLELA